MNIIRITFTTVLVTALPLALGDDTFCVDGSNAYKTYQVDKTTLRRGVRDCDWVAEKTTRCNLYGENVVGKVKKRKMKDWCPISCGNCPLDTRIHGSADLEFYEGFAKAFVGMNPLLGSGSGFHIQEPHNIDGDKFGILPESDTSFNDLCTCDCKAGHDGVGCVGHGGVRSMYSTLLWVDPHTKKWDGQLQAYENTLNFMGKDVRLYPGGPVVYSVACTLQSCANVLSGVFRQSHSAVSCSAGLADRDSNEEDSCKSRCEVDEDSDEEFENDYDKWLDYCDAEVEDTSLGFTGYNL